MAALTLIGCYPIVEEPWHLVEMLASNIESPLDFGALQLADTLRDQSEWQVAYDERLLDGKGAKQLGDGYALMRDASLRTGTFRFCFFLYLDGDRTLSTPFGPIGLGVPSAMPSRLAFIQFEAP